MVSSYQTAGEKGARDDYHLIPREEQLTATWTLTGIRSGAETRAADSHDETNRYKVREPRDEQLTATWTLTGIRSVSRERNN